MGKNGFTIIEVMMAIFVLTVAVGGSFALIQQTLVAASINQQKLIAYYLAQEGIEIVRNIRDSNWLEQRGIDPPSWNDGLGEGDWEVDYNEEELSLQYNEGQFLNIDDNGFYSYSSGAPTNFKRKVTITKISNDNFEVSVKIQWSERGRTHNTEVIDHLYNWKF